MSIAPTETPKRDAALTARAAGPRYERADVLAAIGESEFAELLERYGCKVRGHRSRCPIHGGDNVNALRFNERDGVVLFHCFTKGCGGTAIDLVMVTEGRPFLEALALLAEQFRVAPRKPGEPIAPRQEKKAIRPAPISPDPARVARMERILLKLARRDVKGEEYLEGRGIAFRDGLCYFNLGKTEDVEVDGLAERGYRIAAPLRNPRSGELISFQFRRTSDGYPKVMTLKGPLDGAVFGSVANDIRPGEPILAAEGLTDTLAALSAGAVRTGETDGEPDYLRVVGYPGATSARKLSEGFGAKLPGRDVFIALDPDDAGEQAAQDLARALAVAGANPYRARTAEKDLCDEIRKAAEAGEGAEKALLRLLDAAVRANEYAIPPASEVPPALDLSSLLDGLVNLVRRFVVLSEPQAVVWALWIAHTHAFDAAVTTPYLSVTSPEKRSGKTRLLELSEKVAARPWFTGRVSAAALVRKVARDRPSLLLDESDAAFNSDKDYAEALRGILNTGHRIKGSSSLCVGQGASIEARDFPTFCPKAIAGIGKLPDTVADRAIPIRLRRRTQSEPVERFRERKVEAETAPLHARLEAWALASIERLRTTEPELPNELNDRAQDGAEPLLAIADLAGERWARRSRRALVELFAGATPEDDSLGVRLLRDCRSAFDARAANRLSSADLCAALVAMDESPWGELNKGRPLTLRGLARLLHPFDVGSGTIRLDDGTTAKGYYRASFEDAWGRYLPTPGAPEASPLAPRPFGNVTASQVNTGAGFLDFSKRHTENVVTEEKREIVNADGPCDAVTDKTPLRGGGPVKDGFVEDF